jgi:magnesium-transporting ATPase (P-type)
MKKKFVVLFVGVILLFIAGVCALNATSPGVDPNALRGTAANVSAGLGGTNQVLNQTVVIPENLQIITRVLFGLEKDDKVDLQKFIILIGVWIFVLLFLIRLFPFVPFFGTNARAFLGAIIVSLLIALSGGFLFITFFLVDLGNSFGILKNFKIASLAIAFIFLSALFFILALLLKKIKKKIGTDQARRTGQEIGFASVVGKNKQDSIGV